MAAQLPQWGTAPNFRPMPMMAKRSSISATAELLFEHDMCAVLFVMVDASMAKEHLFHAASKLCEN